MSLCGIYAPIFQWLVHHCPGSCTSSAITGRLQEALQVFMVMLRRPAVMGVVKVGAANLTDCTRNRSRNRRNRRNRRPEEVSKSGVSDLEDLAFEIEWKEASFVFMFKSKTNPWWSRLLYMFREVQTTSGHWSHHFILPNRSNQVLTGALVWHEQQQCHQHHHPHYQIRSLIVGWSFS